MISNPCTIGLGSNTPDRETQINDAIERLRAMLTDVVVSSIYESEAVNGKDAPYLNAVVHGHTSLDPEKLNEQLKAWEESKGRVEITNPDEAHEISIDLDLVIYNYRILRQVDFERHYFNRGYRELLALGAFVSE